MLRQGDLREAHLHGALTDTAPLCLLGRSGDADLLGIAHPLIEGLKNEVICKESSIEKLIPVNKTQFKEAVRIAFSEERDGPGITGF